MALIFGLYHVSSTDVKDRIHNAHRCGITHFDTAQLYGNEKICAEACHPDDIITTKIYFAHASNQIHQMVKRSIRRFGTHRIHHMLLHRPMPHECWNALSQHSSEFDCMGISNYDMHELKDLLSYCDVNGIPRPQIHQMEVHPFVDCIPMIHFCHDHGIRIQGHTVLTQGKFFHYLPLVALASKYKASPAQILLAWAREKKIEICVHSSSYDHLKELTHFISLLPEDIADMNTWHIKTSHRFYVKIHPVPLSLHGISDPETTIQQLVSQLQKDEMSDYPSDLCEHLPFAGESYHSVGQEIANHLYPDLELKISLKKYRTLVQSLKQKRSTQPKAHIMSKKGISCCILRRTKGSYSERILSPQPMPVSETDPKEFIPFFDYLVHAETLPSTDTIFVRGAIFPDGRMDLCKQVVGPSSIHRLCNVVSHSKIVRHFLLGNNVALQENEEEGAKAFASVMRDNTKFIETWYLAGNCIGPTAMKIMAEALSFNTQCKALWLKRNPIGPLGATSLHSMLCLNHTLVLLDLHNCALGDEGVNHLLADPYALKTLKHLYLDANGIESTTSIAAWCEIHSPVTLYLSINRLGDAAIQELATSLDGSRSLKRLCLASTHMHNDGLRAILSMVLSCPTFKCLNVGCYKSTADLGEHPGNFFDEESLPDLTRLLTESPSLEYLNIAGCKITEAGFLSLPRPPKISLEFGKGLWHHVHAKDPLRFVKQPKCVRHIDSIYRGKL